MKLQIDENEIKEAITDYIKNQGVSTVDKTVTIELTAGRNGNGHKAAIKIVACEPDLSIPTPRNDNFKTQFLKDDALEGSDEDNVDESWTSSILDDLEEPQSTRVEPSFSTNEEDTEAAEIETEAPLSETPPTPEPILNQFTQKDLNSLAFEYEQDRTPKGRDLH